jgi:hypothetical protein
MRGLHRRNVDVGSRFFQLGKEILFDSEACWGCCRLLCWWWCPRPADSVDVSWPPKHAPGNLVQERCAELALGDALVSRGQPGSVVQVPAALEFTIPATI